MAAGTLVSRLLGFVRSFVLVLAIGALYAASDAFQLANTLPNMLYTLIAGGALNAVLVPQIVQATKQADGGREFVNRLVTWALVILAVLTIILTVAAPLVVGIYTPSRPDWQPLAIAFALWCIPQVFFYGMYTVLGQVLNARGRFGMYMWAPVVNNIVGLAGLGVFLMLYGQAGDPDAHPWQSWTPDMVFWLAGTATLGVVAQALVLIPPLRRDGFSYRPTFGLRGVGLASARTVALWTFGLVALGQVALWVATAVATTIENSTSSADAVAGLNAMGLGLLLFMLPHSLITVSLVTALFTSISRAVAADDWAAVRADVSTGLRSTGLFTVLGTAGLVALATPLAGVFTSSVGTAALATVIAARALGLVFFSATYLFQRVSYAYEDGKTPFLVQVPGVVLVCLGSLLAGRLPDEYVVAAISLAWSGASVLNAVLSGYILTRQRGSMGLRSIVAAHGRMVVAGVVAGLVGWLVSRALLDPLTSALGFRGGSLLVVLVAGAVLCAVYVGLLALLRVPELSTAASIVRRRLRR